MKKFIDDRGIFEIKVPFDWSYSLHNDHIHTFDGSEVWGDTSFQLSISRIPDEKEKIELARLLGYLPQTLVGGLDLRSQDDELHESEEGFFVTKTWNTIIGDDVLFFTFTYETVPDKKMYKKLEDEKLPIIYDIITTFQFLPEELRERLLNSYRFEMFLQGIGATNVILKKAFENNAFIEATCVLSNQIDSLLRICIVLRRQIINSNDLIETEWVYQGKNDKKKSEKDVYKKAKELSIIDEELYNELFALYEDRNRVIHRFIISEITMAEVERISHEYYLIREKMKNIMADIESEQIKLNVGMVTTDEDVPGNKSHHMSDTLAKIGSLNYFMEKET